MENNKQLNMASMQEYGNKTKDVIKHFGADYIMCSSLSARFLIFNEGVKMAKRQVINGPYIWGTVTVGEKEIPIVVSPVVDGIQTKICKGTGYKSLPIVDMEDYHKRIDDINKQFEAEMLVTVEMHDDKE